MKYRIFIVEDDETIANLLKKHLSSWGYDVFLAEDFSNILQEFAGKDPQLVLLDLKLPFYNGFHWCEEIRKVSQVPVIFISSAADNMNMVMAMSRGADDFIAKPFDMDVLVAKIQAILRRTYSFGNPGNVLEHKGAVLNLSRATLTWNGEETELTRNELRILELLFSQAGKPVSRDAIMTKLWESDSFVDDNTLTVNITRLRKKLEAAGLVDFINHAKRSWIYGVRFLWIISSIFKTDKNFFHRLCFYGGCVDSSDLPVPASPGGGGLSGSSVAGSRSCRFFIRLCLLQTEGAELNPGGKSSGD